MSSYAEFKKELMEDPEVKVAYDELQPEYDIIQAIIDARKSQHITQKDLSEATGITQADIRQECLNSQDCRIVDMGSQLYPFCSEGSYGKYFNGNSTVDFKKQFTVLELDELNGRRHLRQVVLLQLIYQIQQQVFLGERNRKKIIMIDERIFPLLILFNVA